MHLMLSLRKPTLARIEPVIIGNEKMLFISPPRLANLNYSRIWGHLHSMKETSDIRQDLQPLSVHVPLNKQRMSME